MSTFTAVRELGDRFQNYNLEVFKEPRGIIRILQLVFSLLTLWILRSYEGVIDIKYCDESNPSHAVFPVEYPFDLSSLSQTVSCKNKTNIIISLNNNFSSEAEFLFTICWVSIVFVLVIAAIYVKYGETYESNGNLALVDFILSVILAVLWVACLGAWGYGQSQLKALTTPKFLKENLHYCQDKFFDYINCIEITRGSVLGLTTTLILSFLNFFLWAAGLWFLYKETPWYLNFQRT
ncbi:synaptophysin-like isoform X2 [Macrosteles quadrilineatus]|uniref:synaptophysin-like isoform X2 n=1 Tax=Macrosteles quadrilineatus TaxID=74068 RepID=UPI0023E32DB0|nr:synaptophysin-like isoform X2 [Macrosteles quadrilineatus]